MTVVQPPEEQVTVIKPTRGWAALKLREVWHYRELLGFLCRARPDDPLPPDRARRRLGGPPAARSRHGPHALLRAGAEGSLRRRALPAVRLLRPHAVDCFFSAALHACANSLVANAGADLEGLLPAAGHARSPRSRSRLVDFGVGARRRSSCMWSSTACAPTAAVAPAPAARRAGARSTALGLGLWLAALNVRYRDVRYVVPFLLQSGCSPSPVVYPLAGAASAAQPLYGLNPMVGVHRGLPLGAARRWPPGWALAAIPASRRRPARQRPALLPRARSAASPTSSDERRRDHGRGARQALPARRDDGRQTGAARRRCAGRCAARARAPARVDEFWALRDVVVRGRPGRGASASSAATAPARARC